MADSRVLSDVEIRICEEYEGVTIPPKMKLYDSSKANEGGRLELDAGLILTKDMQVDGNEFEGWAIIAYMCTDLKTIELDVKECNSLPKDGYTQKGRGHYHRFLYRVLKFAEQYKWIRLSDELNVRVSEFKKYLEDDSISFVNNIPTKEAGNTWKNADENAFEERLSQRGILREEIKKSIDKDLVGSGEVYRQLPVGLFEKEKSTNTAVFTHGKSAIDLWNINGATLNVVELKTKRPMIEILTEIFFYSNYMLDFIHGKNGFTFLEYPRVRNIKKLRGYNVLFDCSRSNIHGTDNVLNRVNGIMLADDVEGFFPWINTRSLSILNQNGTDELKYYLGKYQYDYRGI